MKAYTITPKGQVTIPAEIREKLKLYPGDKITYEDTAAGILIKPAKTDMIDDEIIKAHEIIAGKGTVINEVFE